MRRIAAISAVVVAVFACLLPAEAQRASPLRSAQFANAADAINASMVRADQRVLALANDFTKALSSAIQEGVVNAEQAERMVKEVEAEFTSKRARIDLLRAATLLKKVSESTAKISGTDELKQLRHQLQLLETAGEVRRESPILETQVPSSEPAAAVDRGELRREE